MKKKDTVINLEPFHTVIRRYEGGFEWQFWDNIGDDYSRKKIVKLKFERWWLSYLARDIAKVLAEEESELKRLRDLCAIKSSEES